jgi:hypothetical protein
MGVLGIYEYCDRVPLLSQRSSNAGSGILSCRRLLLHDGRGMNPLHSPVMTLKQLLTTLLQGFAYSGKIFACHGTVLGLLEHFIELPFQR